VREVVIPVLDEAQALPGVLGRIPAGFAPIVVDNGSSDGSGDVARKLGARVVVEPQKGFGAACFAGLQAATADVVCFMDGDGSLDPAELTALSDRVAHGHADLVLGARRPTQRGAFPPHARLANRVLSLELRRRSGIRTTDLGPMRAARREELLALGIADRRFGWPLEMVLRAAAAGWRVEERAVSYALRDGGRSKVTGTVGGTARAVRDMLGVLAEVDARVAREPPAAVGRAGVSADVLIVIAKAPVAGSSKTRLCPPCTPEQASELARAALQDTLAAVLATPARRRVLVLEGEPGPWLPAGFEVMRQRGGGLEERLAAAFEDVGEAAFLVGMDTPQLTTHDLVAGLEALATAPSVFAPADDGGYWGIGLREPDARVFTGVPMSADDTGARQRARLVELGLGIADLPGLLDVDTIADARAVAQLAPQTRFARALAAMNLG